MRKEIKPRRGSRAMLLANMDHDTAKFFAELWGEEIGQVCEDVVENFPERNEEPIFTNKERNKLTDFGQKYALNFVLSIPPVERVCKYAAYDLREMKESLPKSLATEESRLYFLSRREMWWEHLRERMKELRISKDDMKRFGLNYKEAKNFYFQTI